VSCSSITEQQQSVIQLEGHSVERIAPSRSNSLL